MVVTRLPFVALACALLTACGSTAPPLPSAQAVQGPQPITGWLAGPAAPALEPDDRDKAFAAQIAAVETGQRASWRSVRGHFGFVEPGAEAMTAAGACRTFTHTVYLDGRALRGAGTACRGPAGSWSVTA